MTTGRPNPEDYLLALDDADKRQLRGLAEVGEGGHDTAWTLTDKINVLALLRIDRNHPGLLIGFSVEEDPTGRRVRLTDIGQEVVRLISAP